MVGQRRKLRKKSFWRRTISSMSTAGSNVELPLLLTHIERCMRRLQGNLAYLAALADKKASAQAAQCPQHLKAPVLHTKIKLWPIPAPEGTESKTIAPPDREETSRFLQEKYAKLQSLFPGIDPNNVPVPAVAGRPGAPGAKPQKPGVQTPSQASPVPGNKATPKMATSGAPQQQGMLPTANPT